MQNNSPGPIAWLVGFIGIVIAIFIVGGIFGWLTSIKGTDSGTVCVVREGGLFDGRGIKEIRQPGEGPKPIGAWNHQDCLPVTERDSNDVIEGEPTFPTRDSIQVIADGQALYTLTTDPDKIKVFYKKYGRRKWGGEDLWSDKGWLNFQQQRIQPILLDALRQVIGQYECNSLNNLCQYVQNPEAAVKGKLDKKDEGPDNTQNLTAASRSITDALKQKFKAAFGDDYFENIRYQNLRIRFEPRVQDRITEAQSLRTEAANAKLEADKKVAVAQGEAKQRVAIAQGEKNAARLQEEAYQANPTKRQIDKIHAFCGEDGCDPKVVGGNLNGIIANLGQ